MLLTSLLHWLVVAQLYTMADFTCPYCLKQHIRSKRGLKQHIDNTPFCLAMKRQQQAVPTLATLRTVGVPKATKPKSTKQNVSHQDNYEEEEEFFDAPEDEVYDARDEEDCCAPTSKRSKLYPKDDVQQRESIAQMRKLYLGIPDPPVVGGDPMDCLDEDDDPESDEEGIFDPFAIESSDEEDSDAESEVDSMQDQEDNIQRPVDEKTNREWQKYVKHSFVHNMDLSDDEQAAVRIMHKLALKRATLDTYDAVMEWHLRESGKLLPHQTMGKSKHYVSRKVLMKKLRKRYHMEHQYAKPHRMILPHTKTKVDVWIKRAHDNVLSLLTDPRWEDDDFLFFDDDPFAPPPEDLAHLGEINTGEAYIETYKRLITKPDSQILVPIPLYIDGAVTGQYDKLQVTALKMSIGILNRRAMDRNHGWRELGYVTNYTEEDSRGKQIFVDSGHVAAHEMYMQKSVNEKKKKKKKVVGEESESDDETVYEEDVDKAADYHAILDVLLKSVDEMMKQGMVVDFFYKGKLYKDTELVFFIPFVKCDGDEGDKLCCMYRSRSKHQQCLCRYCVCPNEHTDDQDARHIYKSEPYLKELLDNNKADKLKELSQIGITNCFHGLRFGCHNKRGIHGACPWELLHAILLGIFKYVRDCFFAQVGKDSKTAQEINALAQIYGALFQRQSDRNKPRTKFGKGILKGKLMAKEFSGVLLIMAVLLRSKAGRDILKSGRKKNFRGEEQIRDWTLLVETLLQWEAYLNLHQMEKKHVHRLKTKNRFIMFLLRKVANRSTGMGWKIMKFHAILHLAQDILMFGVPMNVDTGSNESHHKRTKIAAKLTQKDIKTFEKQTSNRMDDFHVLDLALEELDGRPLWDYLQGYLPKTKPTKVEEGRTTGGMKFNVYVDDEDGETSFHVLQTRNKSCGNLMIDSNFLEFCLDLQKRIEHLVPDLAFCAEHTRDGAIFRAHPNYRGIGVWRDWVMIQWIEGDIPAQIWAFLDLSHLDDDDEVELEDGTFLGRGMWAIVESGVFLDEGKCAESDIFKPLKLEAAKHDDDGNVTKRKFYVIDVESFKAPIVVVPNIGTVDEFFLMAPRSQWSSDFIRWLVAPHKLDKTEMLPDTVLDGEEEEDEEW